MKQTRLIEKEHNYKIGDIVTLKNPILPSDIGNKYIIVEFMDSFENEIVFCRLINGNAHYQFLKKNIISTSSLIEDIEKVDKNG